jgi:hypothetical protein
MMHSDQGRSRVTTDDYRQGGASAWWLHADSEAGLPQLASQVQGWCGLRQSCGISTRPPVRCSTASARRRDRRRRASWTAC